LYLSVFSWYFELEKSFIICDIITEVFANSWIDQFNDESSLVAILQIKQYILQISLVVTSLQRLCHLDWLIKAMNNSLIAKWKMHVVSVDTSVEDQMRLIITSKLKVKLTCMIEYFCIWVVWNLSIIKYNCSVHNVRQIIYIWIIIMKVYRLLDHVLICLFIIYFRINFVLLTVIVDTQDLLESMLCIMFESWVHISK